MSQNHKEVLESLVKSAKQIAEDWQSKWITKVHLLAGSLSIEEFSKVMASITATQGKVEPAVAFDILVNAIAIVDENEPKRPRSVEDYQCTMQKSVEECIVTAYALAEAGDDPIPFILHFLAIPYSQYDECSRIMTEIGLTERALEDYRKNIISKQAASTSGSSVKNKEQAIEILAKFGTNLTQDARDGKIDEVIGRDTEIEQICLSAARRRKNNIVIIGEPGIGKTAIAEGLANRMVKDQVPDTLKNCEMFLIDVGSVVSGTTMRGQFEQNVKMILEALEFFENPIMFIDEIHMILGAGGKTDSGTSMSNILKPALARGNIRCIGATTTEEYRSTFEKDTALARRFQKLEIFEPSVSDTIKILTGSIEKYEEFHNVKYDPAAIEEAVVLTNRYIVDRRLPDKAFDMIDQAGARKKNSGVEGGIITAEDIQFEISKVAKIPEKTVKSDDRTMLIDMEKNIKESVVGQDEAVEQVCNAIMISRAGLKDENKPAGAFLFNGSTGTGKTFLAKKMAECLSIPLVRFDMSEYMEKHSVSKLIGAAPGYVGYGDGSAGDGLLINAIESNPHSIILIDEVEKAHPQVLNIFLQVMDEGHLTSSSGKKVKFTNATIVFTSNAGASTRAKSSNGFVNIGSSEVKAIEEMKKFFAPEFFNRLDAVVNFNALTIDNVKRIVVSMIENVAKLVDDKGITLSISDEASEYLATTGFDAQMGARPLSRKIDQCVKLPLSKMIIIDNIESGSHIEVVMESGELKLVHTEPKQKEEEAEIVSEQV